MGGCPGVLSKTIAARYNTIQGGDRAWWTTEADVLTPMPTDDTLSTLVVKLETAPTGNPYIFTIMKNSSPTTLTCTVAVGEKTASDLLHKIDIAPGDLLSIRSSYPSAPTNTPIASWYTIFEADDPLESIVTGHLEKQAARANVYGCLMAGGFANTITSVDGIAPTAGTLKKLYACMSVVDAASINFKLRVGGSESASIGQANITNGVLTPDLAMNTAVAEGAACGMHVSLASGAPPFFDCGWGLVFVPTVANEFMMLGMQNATLTVDAWNNVINIDSSTDFATPETTWFGCLCPAFTAKRIRVKLPNTPGAGKSHIFTLRRYAVADTALSVTLSDSEKEKAADVDVFLDKDQVINLSHTVILVPTTGLLNAWGIMGEIPVVAGHTSHPVHPSHPSHPSHGGM
jgi:hypothetical protein